MLRIQKKDGFASFLEVVIAAMIFVFAGFGIFVAISSLTPEVRKSNKRLQAAYLGQNIIGDLYQGITASSWDCSINATGVLCPGIRTEVFSDFNVVYNIIQLDSGAREVVLEIIYPE